MLKGCDEEDYVDGTVAESRVKLKTGTGDATEMTSEPNWGKLPNSGRE